MVPLDLAARVVHHILLVPPSRRSPGCTLAPCTTVARFCQPGQEERAGVALRYEAVEYHRSVVLEALVGRASRPKGLLKMLPSSEMTLLVTWLVREVRAS